MSPSCGGRAESDALLCGQVIKRRQLRAIQVLGSTGWVFKGIVYAIIGGLSCQSAVGDSDEYASASPQV